MTPASAARRASKGPHRASASTVTLTTCLRWPNAAMQCATAAIGLPVHSMTTSMRGWRSSASQSSPTWVVPAPSAASIEDASKRSGFQPTRARFARAAAGARSAMAATCTPGVFGTWARYMAPNLPAPIRPTISGLPCAARWQSFAYRPTAPPAASGRQFGTQCGRRGAVAPRQRHVVIAQQAVVGQAVERGEIAVRDVFRAFEAPDVVRHRAQAQVHADTVPWREIRRRGVYQAGVKQDHRPGRSLGSDDASLRHKLGDG